MASAVDKLLEEALSLPEDERRDLAERLLKGSMEASSGHREAWTQEAKRRADEVESGQGELLDLDEALGQLRSDLRRVREA